MSLTGTSYASWMQQNPALVEQAAKRMGAAPAPQVTPQVAPAQTQRAPAVDVSMTAPHSAMGLEVPANEPAPVAPLPESRPGTLRQQVKQIDREVLQGVNEEIGSIGRSADAASKASEQKAATIGDALPDQERRVREVDDIIRGNRDREEYVKAQMMKDYDAYRAPIVDDRDSSERAISVVTGIVAAMARNGMGAPIGSAPTAGGAGLAMGMDMLNAHVNRTFAEQQSKIEAAGRGLDGGSKMLRTLAENSTNEAALADRLNANAWAVTERQLAQVEEASKVPAIKENARRLALEARNKGLAYSRAALEKDISSQEAAARAAAQARQASVPFANLVAKEQAGTITAAEMKVLTDWRKDMAGINKTEADIRSQQLGDEKTQAEINKMAREAAGSAVLVEYGGGYFGTQSLTDGESGKAREIIANKNEAQSYLQTLKSIREKNRNGASWNQDDENTARLTMGMLAAKLNVLVGQGAMTETDAERIMSTVKDPTSVSMRGDPSKQYDALSNMLEQSSSAKLEAYGIRRSDARANVGPPVGQPEPPTASSPAQPQPTAPAQPAASTPAPTTLSSAVQMVGPDGRTLPVSPRMVDAFRAAGFVPVEESVPESQLSMAELSPDERAMMAQSGR